MARIGSLVLHTAVVLAAMLPVPAHAQNHGNPQARRNQNSAAPANGGCRNFSLGAARIVSTMSFGLIENWCKSDRESARNNQQGGRPPPAGSSALTGGSNARPAGPGAVNTAAPPTTRDPRN